MGTVDVACVAARKVGLRACDEHHVDLGAHKLRRDLGQASGVRSGRGPKVDTHGPAIDPAQLS